MNAKSKKTIIVTREYEGKKLVFRKIEVIRTTDRTTPEPDTKHKVNGFDSSVVTP